jgi:glycosyltransferase involved in cell wall biosynthesis
MPKVSIIVPNYNHSRFLNQRISSILQQTYQDFELILLDDASTDNSCEVLQPYLKLPHVSAEFNQVNSGSPFKQWNKGLSLAKGEYIWIAESDDYADPHLLERLVQVLDSHPSIGLAYSQSWDVDENNNILSTRHYWTDDLDAERWQQDFISAGKVECQTYLVFKNTIPNASAVLFRAAAYHQSHITNESYKLSGDWLAWAKILSHTDLAYISQPLNYYRTHSQTARKKTWNSIAALQERITIAEYIQQQWEMPHSRSLEVSTAITMRLLHHLKTERLTPLHWQIIHRIANLNPNPRSKLFIYQYFIQHLANHLTAQFSFRSKSLIKSLLHRSIA